MPASPQSPVHLSVSIVLHNSSMELFRHTLQSLQHSVQAAHQTGCLTHVAVYIVDNASNVEYRAQLAREIVSWPQDDAFHLEYIPQPDNLGFGYGHNAVLEKLSSEVHLILNPDVELDGDTLREGLSALLGSDETVLLSPRVFGPGGEQEFLCKRYPSVLVLLLRGFAPAFVCRLFRRRLAAYEMRDQCGGEERADIAIASGCFMLTRTAALRAIAGFDEEFFLYFEDFDLSLRLAQQGRLVYEPAMRIVHQGGYAASKGLRHLKYFITSGVMFFNRHGWRWI